MRTALACLLALACASVPALPAQDRVQRDFDIRDVNGDPLRAPETITTALPNGARTYQTTRSLNGDTVKLDSVSEKVVQKDAHTRIIERTIQRYDPNGNPVAQEKQVITEVKGDDGSLRSTTEKYRTDVNGNMSLAEKDELQERKTGPNSTEAQTTVSRPTINGSFGVVERREKTRNAAGEGKWSENETIYRSGTDGFFPAVKLVTEISEGKNESKENIAEYEVGSTGALELHSQTAKRTVKQADGSSLTETDYFNRHAPGYTGSADSQQLTLRAREITDHKVSGNRAVDTLSLQQPSATDPTRLDPPKLVSQTVCSGACK